MDSSSSGANLLQETIVVNEVRGWKSAGEEGDHLSPLEIPHASMHNPQTRDVSKVRVNNLLNAQFLQCNKKRAVKTGTPGI